MTGPSPPRAGGGPGAGKRSWGLSAGVMVQGVRLKAKGKSQQGDGAHDRGMRLPSKRIRENPTALVLKMQGAFRGRERKGCETNFCWNIASLKRGIMAEPIPWG